MCNCPPPPFRISQTLSAASSQCLSIHQTLPARKCAARDNAPCPRRHCVHVRRLVELIARPPLTLAHGTRAALACETLSPNRRPRALREPCAALRCAPCHSPRSSDCGKIRDGKSSPRIRALGPDRKKIVSRIYRVVYRKCLQLNILLASSSIDLTTSHSRRFVIDLRLQSSKYSTLQLLIPSLYTSIRET